MKAEQIQPPPTPPPFRPVTITLETQAEVDAVHFLLWCGNTRDVAGLSYDAASVLSGYSKLSIDRFNKQCDALKARY